MRVLCACKFMRVSACEDLFIGQKRPIPLAKETYSYTRVHHRLIRGGVTNVKRDVNTLGSWAGAALAFNAHPEAARVRLDSVHEVACCVCVCVCGVCVCVCVCI